MNYMKQLSLGNNVHGGLSPILTLHFGRDFQLSCSYCHLGITTTPGTKKIVIYCVNTLNPHTQLIEEEGFVGTPFKVTCHINYSIAFISDG